MHPRDRLEFYIRTHDLSDREVERLRELNPLEPMRHGRINFGNGAEKTQYEEPMGFGNVSVKEE